MAKDMSRVYAEMLTKELVRLRQSHISAIIASQGDESRRAKSMRATKRELVEQINHELAERVSQMGIFA